MSLKPKSEMVFQLANNNAERTIESIVRIVSNSFQEDALREGWTRVVMTQTEVRDRTNIAYDWFISLRKEYGYSTDRALDVLPRAIRSTLDRDDWKPPPKDRGWSPKVAL